MSYYQRVSRALVLSQSTASIDLGLRRHVGTSVKLQPELMPMLVQFLFKNNSDLNSTDLVWGCKSNWMFVLFQQIIDY